MQTVVKGTKTIGEFKEKQQRLTDLAELAYQRHKFFCDNWKYAKMSWPVKCS